MSGKTAGVVLDPFVGSGTTMVSAQKLGLDGIGIDVSMTYLKHAKTRSPGSKIDKKIAVQESKVERLLVPLGGGAVDELSLALANASISRTSTMSMRDMELQGYSEPEIEDAFEQKIQDAFEGISMRDMVLQGYSEQKIQDAFGRAAVPIMIHCHTCKERKIEDDGTYFEENMWICFPCIFRIRDGEIDSPR